jgi:hypothetical protein
MLSSNVLKFGVGPDLHLSGRRHPFVPIGWTFCTKDEPCCKPENKSCCDAGDKSCPNDRLAKFGVVLAEDTTWQSIVVELIGWLLTGVAISFGAPFWFDLLGQLINIRSAGPKPPRADAQAANET